MLVKMAKMILKQLPMQREEYDEWRRNPPIRTVDTATITGKWDVRTIEETIKENLSIITQPTIDVWLLLRNAQYTFALYMEMCDTGRECRNPELIDAIIATGYQLVINLIESVPRTRLERCPYTNELHCRVDLGIYDQAD